MEDIERCIRISQQKRLDNEKKLKQLDEEPIEHKKMMGELRDLHSTFFIGETQQCKESVTKHLNTITAHKHTIHKLIHSSERISGLPVSHSDAQDIKTLFTESIEFLNNIGDTREKLNNTKDMNPLELITALTTSTEAVGSELYQTRRHIAQLEALKENISVLHQYNLDSSNNSNNSDEIMASISGESTDNGSTIQ